MSDSRIDAERLAALLDGRLDAREREQVMRELAESDDGRAVLADAAAIARELEQEGGTPAMPDAPRAPVLPFRRPEARRSWWSGGRVLLVAAGLAGVALVPRAVTRVGDGTPAAAALVVGLPPGAVPPSPWPVLRDAAQTTVMSPRGRAVRLGARMLDVHLLAAARDAGAATAAGDVERLLLANPPLTGAPIDLYRAMAAGSPVDAARLDASWETIADLAGEEDVRYGAWLEAARVSALRRDVAFFARRESRAMLERAELAVVRSAVDGTPDWSRVGEMLTEVLLTAGR